MEVERATRLIDSDTKKIHCRIFYGLYNLCFSRNLVAA